MSEYEPSLLVVGKGLGTKLFSAVCVRAARTDNIFIFLPCNIINFTLKYQLIAHHFSTLCKTHAKMRRSNPLKFISFLHVSILKDLHQGVNVPIYEVIEHFLFLLILLVWWRHACRCVGYIIFGWSDRCVSCAVIRVANP